MFCPSCGKATLADAKFCEACGANLQNREKTGTDSVQNHLQGLKENEYVKQGSKVSKQYLSFAKRALKEPFTFVKGITDESFINGLISIILFSILFPLTTYFAIRNGHYSLPFGDTVITSAIILFITFLIISGVMLIILKLMHVGANFKEVTAKLGSLAVFPLIFVSTGCLLALLNANIFGSMLAFFSILFLPLSFFATMFSYEKKGNSGLDAYYCIILTVISIVIVFSIISSLVFEALFQNFYHGYYFW